MDNIKQNPRIKKLEADISKNEKTIAFHQEKIDNLIAVNEKLNNEIMSLKNNDYIQLIAMANISYEGLAKLLKLSADEEKKDEGDLSTDEE